MTHCVSCGTELYDDTLMCRHHVNSAIADVYWADGNRAICDYVHRGLLRVPVPTEVR